MFLYMCSFMCGVSHRARFFFCLISERCENSFRVSDSQILVLCVEGLLYRRHFNVSPLSKRERKRERHREREREKEKAVCLRTV